ncbi:hypothetical protein HDV05_004187 [Chytridiales sp. JEL 0842]|nr:hypothetical protein HDV05_004187 [Chytridiales sp. JEL 0842]
MTPEEWNKVLLQHHLQRLSSISSTTTAAASNPPPKPITSVYAQYRINQSSKASEDSGNALSQKPVLTITGLNDHEDNDAAKTKDEAPVKQPAQTQQTPLPTSIEAALQDPKERRLLYLSFRHLMLTCIETLEALAYAIKELIPAGTRWMNEVWSKYPMNSSTDLCIRVKLFAVWRKLYSTISSMTPPPANKDTLKRQIRTVIFSESAIDLVNTLLVDVEGWNRDSAMLEWAWKVHVYGEDAVSNEDMEKLTTEVIDLPFQQPRDIDQDRLSQYLKDPRSRSDGYCLLMSSIERLASKIHLERADHPGPLQDLMSSNIIGGGNAGLGGMSTMGASMRKMTMKLNKYVEAPTKVATAFQKMEWLAAFMSKHIPSSPPSPTLALGAINILKSISSLADPKEENSRWQEQAYDLEMKLKYAYDRHEGSVKTGSHPPLVLSGLAKPSFITRILHLKRKDPLTTDPKFEASSSSPLSSNSSILSDVYKPRLDFDDLLASLDDMWFQVDPFVDRIVFKPPPGVPEKLSEEIMISQTPGSLLLTRKNLIWSINKLTQGPGAGGGVGGGGSYILPDASSGFVLPLAGVKKFTWGKVAGGSEPVLVHSGGGANIVVTSTENVAPVGGEKDGGTGGVADGDEAGAGKDLGPLPTRKIFAKKAKGGMQTSSGRKAFYLSVFTKDEVFKFYPFYDNEIHSMVTAFSAVSGLQPFKEELFVQSVLTKKLEFTRRRALSYILEEEEPWIENSADLAVVIDALTAENQPQRIVDIERLFHSCRLEREVTKEAMLLLRKAWHLAQSDQVKLKILSVVDRLLDKVIMRQEDPVFTTTFKWLKHLEETVNPYKNAEALKLIINLVRRAKLIQIEPLAPLVRNQCHALFDNYDDHIFLLQFMEEFGTKLTH